MWDAIMSVGKTPEITKAYMINAYSSMGDEITQTCIINGLTLYGSATTSGESSAVTDLYRVSDFTITLGLLGDQVRFDLDVGKLLILRNIVIDVTASAANYSITITSSKDGVNYTSVRTVADTIGSYTINLSNLELRYLRILVTEELAGAKTILFDKIRVFLDSKQYV